MQIVADDLSQAEMYKLMNCMIVPRPIAWVTSVSAEGIVNLAPFSTFNIVCYDPPLLGMNIGQKPDGSPKDTARNARLSGELVVHIADEGLVDLLHASAAPHPADVSEAELLKMALTPCIDVAVPRLCAAPLALECKVFKIIDLGPSSEFVIAQIVRVHARDGLVEDNKIDSMALRPLSRLGGPVYGTLGPSISKAAA